MAGAEIEFRRLWVWFSAEEILPLIVKFTARVKFGFKFIKFAPSRKRNFRVSRGCNFKIMADGKGFEPSKACTLHAFQACSFNRSDTHLN